MPKILKRRGYNFYRLTRLTWGDWITWFLAVSAGNRNRRINRPSDHRRGMLAWRAWWTT